MFKLLATAYLFIWVGLVLGDLGKDLPASHLGTWDGLGVMLTLALFVVLGYLAGRENN